MSETWLRAVSNSPSGLSAEPYAVNIGCWDGKSFNDPVYPLYAAGFAGLAIEWGEPPELACNLGDFAGVRLLTGRYVTPTNIGMVLGRAGCPQTPDFLKIDIDGADGDVLGAVLAAGYRPRAIQVEVNPEIPPPYAFSVIASNYFVPGGATGFFGMSLQFACDAMARFDYVLVDLDFDTEYTHDALFVSAETAELLPAYRALEPGPAFLARPPLLPHIEGVTTEAKVAWRDRSDHYMVLQEIWDAMLDAGLRKHGHSRAPFTLYLARDSPSSAER